MQVAEDFSLSFEMTIVINKLNHSGCCPSKDGSRICRLNNDRRKRTIG